MNLFEPLTVADVCLLAFAVIMMLLLCNEKRLRKERKILASLVCIVVGLLSVGVKLSPTLSPLLMLMVGAFSVRLALRLRAQARTATTT